MLAHQLDTAVQDTDKMVRLCMCDQLPAVAQAIGREATAAVLLPEILELASDEEGAVRSVSHRCTTIPCLILTRLISCLTLTSKGLTE